VKRRGGKRREQEGRGGKGKGAISCTPCKKILWAPLGETDHADQQK